MTPTKMKFCVSAFYAFACGAALSLRDLPPAADTITYLDGSFWTASSDSGDTIAATIPGEIISDLQTAGRIPDPWLNLAWRDNSYLWDNHSWQYSTSFLAPTSSASTWLVFDGVKMAADISLNGVAIGTTLNWAQRYFFPVALAPGLNNLTVSFQPTISDSRNDNGRYMGCSGGWDWAPYSLETTGRTPKGIRTFSKGIWKSVYIASVSTAAITNVKPLVYYLGPYPQTPLTDATAGAWRVDVTVYMSAPSASSGSVSVVGAWNLQSPVTVPVTIPGGATEVAFNVSLPVAAGSVSLWWPNGLSTQRPLYPINITYTPSRGSPVTTTRSVGFRTIALVTADDSNPSALAGVPGSGNLTMRLKVNGADIFARGANWIPLEEIEARGTAASHWRAVQSAADAGMNVLRIWGGGQWPYDAFLDACDTFGILLYVDAQYASQADSHHFATPGPLEENEIRYQMRRIAAHPSIALWDACNECGGSADFAAFVAPTMASEDNSRPLWPASPSAGWADGVDRLWGYPMPGRTLAIFASTNSPISPAPGCNCTAQSNARYFGFPLSPFNTPLPIASMADCCQLCTNTSGCAVALYQQGQGCQLLAPPFSPVYMSGMTALFPAGHGTIPPVPIQNTIEQHGPYAGGSGWPTVNGGNSPSGPYDPALPPALSTATNYGTRAPGVYTSEYGVGQVASFELMAPTLDPSYWSLHGGLHPADNCTGGFAHVCTGGNVMAQRNYKCDNAFVTYFPPGSPMSITLDTVGAYAFAGQLYLCQIANSLLLKSYVEEHKSENIWGLQVWQLGEVWPTYGWGTLEYSSGPGSVSGGRWKPAHYFLAATNKDQFAACGKDARCFVKNDNPLAGFTGTLSVSLLKLSDASSRPLLLVPVALGPGANAMQWLCADGKSAPPTTCTSWTTILSGAGCSSDGTDCLLMLSIANSSGAIVSSNQQLLAVPGKLALPSPRATIQATVGETGESGAIPISLETSSTALFVTLFTLANGRFSDNVITVLPGAPAVVEFFPFAQGQEDVLRSTLRVDHLQKYFLQ